jgi:hypothetical protein
MVMSCLDAIVNIIVKLLGIFLGIDIADDVDHLERALVLDFVPHREFLSP